MSTPTPETPAIPDKAVTAAAVVAAAKILFAEDYGTDSTWERASALVQRDYLKTARAALEASLPIAFAPHQQEIKSLRGRLADAQHRAAAQRSVDHGEIVDHTITIGRLNAALREEAGKREALMEMVAHRDTTITDLRRECDNLLTRLNEAHATAERLAGERDEARDLLITEHVHTSRHCGHDIVPMDVEGASECKHCGPYHAATEFCPNRCDVVRVEHEHAASRRGEQGE